MKAVVYTKYGPPEVLQLKEIPRPVPEDNELLVKVHAASVNDWDWGLLRGMPFANRMISGLLKPKIRIIGCDIAGTVEAVGSRVSRFRPGDGVFGDLSACGFGAFAEYACASEDALELKPTNITYEEAAAVPQAAVLAIQGLRDKDRVQPGQKVLINGAGGGAGTFAIQIAKLFGAEVTGVDSTRKLDIMSSTGANHVIDYTQENFTKRGQRYDRILDFAAHHSIFDYNRALSPGGIYCVVGGSTARLLQIIFLGPLILKIGRKKLNFILHKANKDLDYIKELMEANKLRSVIDKCYPLSEVPEALKYFGEGQARGKVVITIESGDSI